MYTSDIKSNDRISKDPGSGGQQPGSQKSEASALKKARTRARIIYITAAVFCFIFQLVYEHFSHGVTSYYMVLAFLIPIAGGILTEILFRLAEKFASPKDGYLGLRVSLQLLAGAVIWFTLGSIFRGVLEIYGTTNKLNIVFLIIGTAQTAAAVIAFLCSRRRPSPQPPRA